MAIIINNSDLVKEDATALAANSVQIDSIRHSIDFILGELAEYWEQTQQDAQAFTTGLKDESKYLTNIVECNKAFAEAITSYITATENVGKRTTGGRA